MDPKQLNKCETHKSLYLNLILEGHAFKKGLDKYKNS